MALGANLKGADGWMRSEWVSAAKVAKSPRAAALKRLSLWLMYRRLQTKGGPALGEQGRQRGRKKSDEEGRLTNKFGRLRPSSSPDFLRSNALLNSLQKLVHCSRQRLSGYA